MGVLSWFVRLFAPTRSSGLRNAPPRAARRLLAKKRHRQDRGPFWTGADRHVVRLGGYDSVRVAQRALVEYITVVDEDDDGGREPDRHQPWFMERPSSAGEDVTWDRVLPIGAAAALVDSVLILGYVFSAFSGAGLVLESWALMAMIVGVTALGGAIVVELIARHRLTGPTAAHLALIVGPLLGFAAGYLLQPRGGPV